MKPGIRKLRSHLRTVPYYALDSEQYFDRQIQDESNSKSWIRSCALILREIRAEIRRRAAR